MKISFANVYSRHMVVPERRENSPQGENMVRGFDRIIDKVAASSDVYQPTNEVHPRRLVDNYSNIKLEFSKAKNARAK
jgi:hypothetical protein